MNGLPTEITLLITSNFKLLDLWNFALVCKDYVSYMPKSFSVCILLINEGKLANQDKVLWCNPEVYCEERHLYGNIKPANGECYYKNLPPTSFQDFMHATINDNLEYVNTHIEDFNDYWYDIPKNYISYFPKNIKYFSLQDLLKDLMVPGGILESNLDINMFETFVDTVESGEEYDNEFYRFIEYHERDEL